MTFERVIARIARPMKGATASGRFAMVVSGDTSSHGWGQELPAPTPRTRLRIDRVRAEFSLTALAYNLRRAIGICGVETMMADRPGAKGETTRPNWGRMTRVDADGSR